MPDVAWWDFRRLANDKSKDLEEWMWKCLTGQVTNGRNLSGLVTQRPRDANDHGQSEC